MRIFLFLFLLFAIQTGNAQQKSGTIKVRKAKNVQGLYVLDEGDYYKVKLYLRFFENNEAIFLRAPLTAEKAKDSTARLLYTYHKPSCSYKIVNDSVFIQGAENKIPFTYRGIIKNGVLSTRKLSQSKQTKAVFKKVL